MREAADLEARVESEIGSARRELDGMVQRAQAQPRSAMQLANLPVDVTGRARYVGFLIWMEFTLNLQDPTGRQVHFVGNLFGFNLGGLGGLVGGAGRTVPFADLIYYGRNMYCEVALTPVSTHAIFKVGGASGTVVGAFDGGGLNIGTGGLGGWGEFRNGWQD